MVAAKNSAGLVISALPSGLPDFSHLTRFPTSTELTEVVEKLVHSFGGFWDAERARQCKSAIERDGVESVIEYILWSADYPEEVVAATLARMRGRLS
jgi:hypothetical protein